MTPEAQERLAALFVERITAQFVWGRNDCCLFAADAVIAATGRDPADGLRSYADAISAARLVKRLGGMAAIGDKSFGPRIAPAGAVFGDLGLVTNDGRECLAVFGGSAFHVPGEHGLTIVPIENCTIAWRME